MFVDTVAAVVEVPNLAVDGFTGGVVSENWTTGERSARLFRNPAPGEPYAPRVTYWTGSQVLKVEFSVQKMSVGSDTPGATGAALDAVDRFLAGAFGAGLPGVRTWRVQRVDYCVDIQVGEALPAYMAVLERLQIASWSRHPFAGQGVVWKSRSTRGRWVKFYDKSKESGNGSGVLRFEVSNYRDAVRYMAEHWFGCERSVAELVKPGRAVFVLCYFWDKLGLGRGDYGHEQAELWRLRAVFGARGVAAARYVLCVHREFGPEAWRRGLVSRSSYYRWLARLKRQGFLASAGPCALPALCLFGSESELASAENLKSSSAPPVFLGEKTISWKNLAEKLGFRAEVRPISYLLEVFNGTESTKSA